MIPAKCRNSRCGHVFQTNFFGAGSSARRITMSGNVTICPKCGSRADLIDGSFDMNAGELVVRHAPKWSREVLRQLKGIAEHARETDMESAAILKEVEAIAPSLAADLKKRSLPSQILIALLFLLVTHCTFNTELNVDLDINRLIDQAVEIYNTGTVTPAPPPAQSQESETKSPDEAKEAGSSPSKTEATKAERPGRRAQRRAKGRSKKQPR